MKRFMSVLLVGVAACGGDSGSTMNFADASTQYDGAASSDASAFQGLTLAWAATPVLPGSVSSTVNVTSVKFHVKKLEVLGDAGALPETTREDFDLSWNTTMPGPFPYTFADAPAPAIYSKVRINLDKGSSNAPSVEILGTTTANGPSENFQITSTRKLDLEITGYNVVFDVGDNETMTVAVKLDVGFDKLEWDSLPTPGNVRTLNDSSSQQMDRFFENLEDVFKRSM